MAVVTHGSFDEGPIVLALPSVYEYAPGEETDPIFMAWDKSTGISITHDHISDFDAEVAAYADAVSTDMQNNYVPFNGAAQNVDLGTSSLYTSGNVEAGYVYSDVAYITTVNSVRSYVSEETPLVSTELATKGYVDGLLTGGLSWQISVRDFVANYAALPGGASEGDRYITDDTQHIWEWESGAWVEHVPSAGWITWVINEQLTYLFDGLVWVNTVSSINHNDTLNKEGGGDGHWYHLSALQKDPIDIITDTDTADKVTGLAVGTKGISIGIDGTQTAWVELEWDPSTYDALDHYILYYQKADVGIGWTEINATTETVVVEGLVAGIDYNFYVVSVNKYGTVSVPSDIITATTEADTDAPEVTTVDSATGGIQMILIEWTHNTAYDLSHYNVYRNTINDSGTATLKGNTKSNRYTDAPLPIDSLYYYWVKAVDMSGNECDTFSTEVHATTKGVESEDVTSISADKILITGVTYLSNWTGTDSTKIDGAEIETGTVTLSKLEFTPETGYGLIGAINAYEDGIQINASNINVVGATLFAAKTNGTGLSKIYIYPNTETGIRVTDDYGYNVFLVEIGGTNVGDVTIGNWANNQGVKYDKSAGASGTLNIRGTINASGGTMTGITSFQTSPVSSICTKIAGADIYESNYNSDDAFLLINYFGYNGGYTKYRNTSIGDGKGVGILTVDGSDKQVHIDGGLTIDSTTQGVLFPKMTTIQREAMTKVAGTIVYDTDVRRFCGCILNNIGVLEWWTLGLNTNLG